MNNTVTIESIENKIISEKYIQVPETLTICVLYLENGFIVTGESACVDSSTFNKEIGERIARENAVEKIWPLEGYLLSEDLYRGSK